MRSPAARRAADNSAPRRPSSASSRGFLGFQFLDALARVADASRSSAAAALAVGDHLFDRVAVLPLQAVDQVQPILDLLQPPRVELDAVAVVAQLAADVVQQRRRLAQLLQQRRGRRIDAREPRQRLLGRAQRVQRARAGLLVVAARNQQARLGAQLG